MRGVKAQFAANMRTVIGRFGGIANSERRRAVQGVVGSMEGILGSSFNMPMQQRNEWKRCAERHSTHNRGDSAVRLRMWHTGVCLCRCTHACDLFRPMRMRKGHN